MEENLLKNCRTSVRQLIITFSVILFKNYFGCLQSNTWVDKNVCLFRLREAIYYTINYCRVSINTVLIIISLIQVQLLVLNYIILCCRTDVIIVIGML